MSDEDKWEKLGDSVILRVSRRGGGLYLFLEKDLVEYHRFKPGDKVKVRLQEVLRSGT